MPVRRAAALLLALAAGGLARPAAAQDDGVVLPLPGSAAWRPQVFPSVERHTRYRVQREDGVPVLRAEAECSASGRVLRLQGIDLERTPRLRWRWRVDRGLDVLDEQAREGDDFAARVYVLFPADPRRETLWQQMRRGVVRRLYGQDVPGPSLSFVWASRAPVGHGWPSPFTSEVHVQVLRSGADEHGVWRWQEVDLADEYRRVYGARAPAPRAIALMTDADQTCGLAVARYADFSFVRSPGN